MKILSSIIYTTYPLLFPGKLELIREEGIYLSIEKTTTHICIHTCGLFRVASYPNLLVLWPWELHNSLLWGDRATDTLLPLVVFSLQRTAEIISVLWLCPMLLWCLFLFTTFSANNNLQWLIGRHCTNTDTQSTKNSIPLDLVA